MLSQSQKLNTKLFDKDVEQIPIRKAEMRILGAFQSRSAAARGGVAGFFSKKIPVTWGTESFANIC